jgi:hypothetical protein
VLSVDNLPSALAAKIRVEGTCWLWTGAKGSHGYGTIRREGMTVLAHRYAYELAKGALPTGAQVHHRCHRRACVNPAHLEALTPQAHLARHPEAAASTVARHAAVTHCPHGHPYDAANTRWYRKAGYLCRACRECLRTRRRKYPVSPRAQAVAWLQAQLASGEWTALPLSAREAAGIRGGTFDRAKRELGVECKPAGPGSGKGGKMYRLLH